ncbi:MAG: RIP metalloprotease RseP [Nitrosomonadales bacterium]|nr:RIP metalloprotease RseP [Nitrosomonadales bacterium]
MHSILSFLFTISLVVIVHEFGHFAMAKFFKVSVEKFSVGFGRALYKKQFGLTEFSLRLIPLGGYVKFYEKSKFDGLNLFENISVLKRSIIVLAGPLINFFFAFILLLFLNQGDQFKILPKITAVKAESIASQVGFEENDLIISINKKEIDSLSNHNKALIEFANEDLNYLVLRNNKEISITIYSENRLDLKKKKTNKNNLNGLYFFPSGKNSLVIDKVVKDSPAFMAGVKKNDQIVSVDNNVIFNSSDFVDAVNSKPNEEIIVSILRNKEVIPIKITPMLNPESIKSIGIIGVMIKPKLSNKINFIKSIKFNGLDIIIKSFYDLLSGIKMVFNSFIHIITGNIDWRLLSGPISIAELSSDTLSMGLITYFSFLVFLNINIGFLNLLPIPTLDGGQLIFYAIEAILKRPLNRQKMIISQRLGVIILFLVFTLAVYNDVFNFLFY